MTAQVAEVQAGQLGPGTLKIGATGSEIDISCLLNNAVIASEKDEADSTTKLCGDVRPGAVTYTFTLSGNVDTDIGEATGLFALSQSAKGTQQDFEFVPSTALATSATGKLVIDPLDFGADEMGADLTSDFEWGIVGEVDYAYGGVVEDAGAQSADEDEPLPVGEDTTQQAPPTSEQGVTV